MFRLFRVIYCWLLKLSGANALFRYLNRNRTLILWYHGISETEIDALKGYDERHVSQDIFRKHLAFLNTKGYRFLSLDEYLTAREKRTLPKKTVVLTFDDGFRNVVQNAVPSLRDFGAQGIMYVVVDCAKNGRLLWTDQVETWVHAVRGDNVEIDLDGHRQTYSLKSRDERLSAMQDIKRRLRKMDDQLRQKHLPLFVTQAQITPEFQIAGLGELKAVDKQVLQIASHTMSHPNCTQLRSQQEFDFELKTSKTELESALGRSIAHFAYPAGAFNDSVIHEVKRAGYATAVTTIPGFNDLTTDLFRLKRIGTNQSLIMFEAMTSGAYFFFTRLLRFARPGRHSY